MTELDENKSEGKRQLTGNLWGNVTAILHSDTASVEWIHIYDTTILELVYFVGLKMVLVYFLEATFLHRTRRRSRIYRLFYLGIGSLRGLQLEVVDDQLQGVSVDHILVQSESDRQLLGCRAGQMDRNDGLFYTWITTLFKT